MRRREKREDQKDELVGWMWCIQQAKLDKAGKGGRRLFFA